MFLLDTIASYRTPIHNRFNLFFIQWPPLSLWQLMKLDWTNSNAQQIYHMPAQQLSTHASNLMFPPFFEDHAQGNAGFFPLGPDGSQRFVISRQQGTALSDIVQIQIGRR
jgi:hypothetical protein